MQKGVSLLTVRPHWVLTSLVVACAGGDRMAAESLDPDADASSPACSEGARRACDCDEGTGQAVCKQGRYLACECADLDEDQQSADSDPPREPPAPLACKAGYYAGGFSGQYKPGIVGLGLFGSGLDVEVVGAADGAAPSLTLTLEEGGEGTGEFSTFTVGNGCMAGLAQSGGTETPFVARLTGDLDCSTGKFEGLLDGHYTFVGVPGLEFSFKGPITAQFNLKDTSLDDGVWTIMEPPALIDGQPAGGGQGTWTATYRAKEPPAGGEDPCKSIIASPAEDAGSVRDAGATARDAGAAVRDAG